MKQRPFEVERIRKLLAEDKIEAAIDVLLENLKNVIDEAEKLLNQGEAFMSMGLTFLISPEIMQTINEFRNTIIILSASIKRIELAYRNQLIDWKTRHELRNRIIFSLISLLEDLEKFNEEYGELFPPESEYIQIFPSKKDMLPASGVSNFLEKPKIYISMIKSLSQRIGEFAQMVDIS